MNIKHATAKRSGLASTGRCITHHGELIQGALRLDRGVATPCLISLPRQDRASLCRLELFEADGLEVVPSWKDKALRAARITLARFGLPHATGRLTLWCEVETGFGLGSSTADVVAAIRAAAAALGVRLRSDEVAAIAVEAEVASDPLMFDRAALLFAQRQGRVLEEWGDWYPAYVVFSCNLSVEGARIETLSLPPPTYSSAELDRFEGLVAAARDAFRRRDARAVAVAATRSAVLNQSRLRLGRFEAMLGLALELGALGVQIAHSGVVGGVLLDPRDTALEERISALASGWRRVGDGRFELFETNARRAGLFGRRRRLSVGESRAPPIPRSYRAECVRTRASGAIGPVKAARPAEAETAGHGAAGMLDCLGA